MIDYPNLPLMFTVADVQRHLGVSRSSAYNIVKAGYFPIRRLGGKGHTIRIPVKPFLQWALGDLTLG